MEALVIPQLRAHAPFDEMEPEALRFLAKRLQVAYHPRGQAIVGPDSGIVERLHIVKQGSVRGSGGGHGARPDLADIREIDRERFIAKCFGYGIPCTRSAGAVNVRMVAKLHELQGYHLRVYQRAEQRRDRPPGQHRTRDQHTADARTDASTAARSSRTRFGVPVDPDVAMRSGMSAGPSSQERACPTTSPEQLDGGNLGYSRGAAADHPKLAVPECH